MAKLGSLDIASHYIGATAVPKTYKCEDTVFSAGGTGFTADVLIVGGGGGGGQRFGGGGGAGGYREFTKKYYTGTSYIVTVGAGGSGSTSDSLAGSDGSNSSVERIAHGGGGGGSVFTQTAGRDGGSGGGNNPNAQDNAGSSIVPRCNGASQGNAGGDGYKLSGNLRGGGGGGSSVSGASAEVSGNGGDGNTSTITGSSVAYAGGGGGAGYNTTSLPAGSGGAGGGGNGSDTWNGTAANSAGDNGTANTGGGGGGGTQRVSPPTGANGGNGGSGFVVIKFPGTHSITIGGGLTYTSSTSGGYTTVQFTAGTDTISFTFNPALISGLQLWLDADDSETITLNGGTVSQWDDKSGNGYHVSQGTASNQPTYQSSVLNSKSVVRFDGVNDGLINTVDTPVGSSTNRTVFVVFNWNGSGGTIDYALVLGYLGAASGTVFGISEEIAVRVNSGSRVWNASANSTHAIVTIMLDGTSTTDLSAWKNGSSLGVSTTSTQTINTAAGIGVGRRFDGNYLYGDIAEIIVYNSALSTSDRESVESYLSTKWGIS